MQIKKLVLQIALHSNLPKSNTKRNEKYIFLSNLTRPEIPGIVSMAAAQNALKRLPKLWIKYRVNNWIKGRVEIT